MLAFPSAGTNAGAMPRMPQIRQLPTLDPMLVRSRAAAVLGAVLLGMAAIAFADFGELAQEIFQHSIARHEWAPLLVTPLGFMLVAWMTRRWMPAARGSGIPQVMAASRNPASEHAAELLSLRVALAKTGGTLAMLLTGGSVGREGPTVQISAAIMLHVHRVLRVPVTSGVVIAGGAAGVAAAFNTPLAGVAFAIEELASAFEQRVAMLVMVAVMVAGLVSLSLAGDYVYFGATSRQLPVSTILMVAPLAGIIGGVLGGLFARTLVAAGQRSGGFADMLRARPVVTAGVCGLIVAGVGIATGVTWGTGYDTTRALLAGETAPMSFGPAKFVANLATALSGAPGGIFAPSLSVGAGLGQLLSLLFPASPSGAIVLLGMIGYFAGVVRAPLTAVILMAEMTADRSMILPLFVTALIADYVSAGICRPKLYHALARQFR